MPSKRPNPNTVPYPASDSISAAFHAHKSRILSQLSIPDDIYTDLSPKGSVDVQIRSLIDAINSLPGVVTTSSCSGRISVFVQGSKGTAVPGGAGSEDDAGIDINGDEGEHEDKDSLTTTSFDQESVTGRKSKKSKGKGLAGRWLFVSHDPLPVAEDGHSVAIPEELATFLESFSASKKGSGTNDESTSEIIQVETKAPANTTPTPPRLIHLLFEPLILHISTASLFHAKPLLALALEAGFRESGLQSLKCLTAQPSQKQASSSNRGDTSTSWPLVAIRTTGLPFSTVIGLVDKQGREKCIVSKEHLQLMLGIANGRFEENTRRIGRIELGISRLTTAAAAAAAAAAVQTDKASPPTNSNGNGTSVIDSVTDTWEDKDIRAARKKAEGLKRQKDGLLLQRRLSSSQRESDDQDGLLLGLNDTVILPQS